MEVRPGRKKENKVVGLIQRAEMRMVIGMCGVKLYNRVQSKRLRERLDDIISVGPLQQNGLRWYGRVLRKEDKEDNNWGEEMYGV